MFHGTGNVYARFTDIFDPPEPQEPTAVFSPEGKIEFVKTNGDPVPHLPDRNLAEEKPRGRLRKKFAAFFILCIVVFIVTIFTLANFIVLMKNITKISWNSQKIEDLPDQIRLKPEALNASIQDVLSNWSDHVTLRLRDELRIKPEQIDSAVQNALTKWSEDNIPRLKDELSIKPEEINTKINNAMTEWSSSNLPKLKDELRVKPEELDARIQILLTNWTSSNIPRIKDELRVKQQELDNKVQAALSAWSGDVVQRLKDELKIKPEQLNATVQSALDAWSRRVIVQLKDELELKPETLDSRIQNALTNMSNDVLSRLRVELLTNSDLFEERVASSLSNLSENILSRLKDELEISPLQLEAGIRQAMSNMSTRALAMIRGVCDIFYGDKCYWAVKAGSIRFDPAASLCHDNGAEAANIYSQEQFQKIETYLRSKMPPLTTVWLGLTRNLTAGVNYLENGEISNFSLPWYPGYPLNNNPSNAHIGYHIEKDVDATHQGFFNDPPFTRRHGILCEL